MTREEKIYELRCFCNMQDGCDKCDLDELSINCAFSKMDDEKINELYYKIRSGEDITKEHSKTIAEITGAAKERNEEEKTCLVVQCANCGRIHVYLRKWRDGDGCTFCGGGPLQILGDAIVLENEVNTMDENNLGGRIKGLLKKRGLTQKELAEKVGVTEVSVSRYISGERTPKGLVIANMANALHTTSDYLLGIEEDITKKQKTIAEITGDAKEDSEKSKTVTGILKEVKQEMCDGYCKYPTIVNDREDLFAKDGPCVECPLNKL